MRSTSLTVDALRGEFRDAKTVTVRIDRAQLPHDGRVVQIAVVSTQGTATVAART